MSAWVWEHWLSTVYHVNEALRLCRMYSSFAPTACVPACVCLRTCMCGCKCACMFTCFVAAQVSAPMPLGVLSRFWMQPDIITAIAVGKGLVLFVNAALGLVESACALAWTCSMPHVMPTCIGLCMVECEVPHSVQWQELIFAAVRPHPRFVVCPFSLTRPTIHQEPVPLGRLPAQGTARGGPGSCGGGPASAHRHPRPPGVVHLGVP